MSRSIASNDFLEESTVTFIRDVFAFYGIVISELQVANNFISVFAAIIGLPKRKWHSLVVRGFAVHLAIAVFNDVYVSFRAHIGD